ncbi:PIG-L deacetylase family protein [Jatrophihabitans fulvus]
MTQQVPATVVPLTAVRSAREAAMPVGAGSGDRFGRELTVMRDWPARIAVVVGEAVHPATLDTLAHLGFVPVATSVEGVERTIAHVGPFTFLVLGADVFAGDDSVSQVRRWHAASPGARLKLVHADGVPAPEVLVRAIRAGVTDVVDVEQPGALAMAMRAAMTLAGLSRERVLAIGAHPDDVEIGCGATLLDHRRRGDRISILTLSRGAVGGDQEQRLAEAASTADAIGAQLIFGDLPDTRIDGGVETIRLIERVVAEIDPSVVYVHSSHDNHQDHRAVHTATRSATRGVRRVFAYQSPSATDEFLPTQFVNVDDTVRRKVEVLQMFTSQSARSYLEPELVAAGARYWARHLAANARYAEPFEVVRSVGELRHSVTTPDSVLLDTDPKVVTMDDRRTAPAVDVLAGDPS